MKQHWTAAVKCWTVLAGLAFFLCPYGGVAGHPKVSGLNTHTSYGTYNGLYQWEFGPTAETSRQLGPVKLGVDGVFGYNIKGSDIAVLSDGRIAITHRDEADSKWQISVLTPLYDAAGDLTNATLDATFDQTQQHGLIAALPDGGMVTTLGGNAVVYVRTGANTWIGTTVALGDTINYGISGLIRKPGTEFVVGHYDRRPYRYNADGLLAKYNGTNSVGNATWGCNAYSGTGLRHQLLANGWLVQGDNDWGTVRPTSIMDGTEADGEWHNGWKGEITNADGSHILRKPWAGLRDGRVVTLWASGWGRNNTDFRVYTLVENPGGRAGTIGANGEDFEATLGGTSGTFMGRIAGDYMVPPPAPPPKGTVIIFQ